MKGYVPSASMTWIRCCGSSVLRSSQPVVEQAPRSITYKYTLIFPAVNLMKTNAALDGG